MRFRSCRVVVYESTRGDLDIAQVYLQRLADDVSVSKLAIELLLIEKRRGQTTLTLGEFESAFSRGGRNNAPALLWDAYLAGNIDPDVVTAMVGPAWSGAEYPERTIDRDCWLFLFWAAGYTETDATGRGRPAKLPPEPVVLWRGCVPDRRLGMSWTSDRGMAEKFAWNELRGRPVGRLYTCRAHRSLLARIDGPMDRGEAEYVINPARVRVSEVEDSEHR